MAPAYMEGDSPTNGKRFPRAWVQYPLAISAAVVGALDISAYALRWGLLLAGIVVLAAIVVESALLKRRLARHGWRGVFPILALIGAMPLSYELGGALIAHRFEASKSAYVSVATEALSGTYPEQLRSEDAVLGRRVGVVREDGETGSVVGVEFAVISYGFAGHVGYFYFANDAAERQYLMRRPPSGWTSWGRTLGDRWHVVHHN